jgi:hypothetical protein
VDEDRDRRIALSVYRSSETDLRSWRAGSNGRRLGKGCCEMGSPSFLLVLVLPMNSRSMSLVIKGL